jgi:carboxy-cis,cis-muconate cyclase
LAFVPVLGTNSIEVYDVQPESGILTHVFTSLSTRQTPDGPRHLKIHPNGRVLYCVTEHGVILHHSSQPFLTVNPPANTLDIYNIHRTPPKLAFHSTRSLLPPSLRDQHDKFRGDTLLLHPSASASGQTTIFATTRGGNTDTNGWLSIFKLDTEGYFVDQQGEMYHETPTSGGKANAIDLIAKSRLTTRENLESSPDEAANLGLETFVNSSATESAADSQSVWILLTDDSPPHPGVRILEWNGWQNAVGVREVASWPTEQSSINDSERMEGGSHAIWLV